MTKSWALIFWLYSNDMTWTYFLFLCDNFHLQSAFSFSQYTRFWSCGHGIISPSPSIPSASLNVLRSWTGLGSFVFSFPWPNIWSRTKPNQFLVEKSKSSQTNWEQAWQKAQRVVRLKWKLTTEFSGEGIKNLEHRESNPGRQSDSLESGVGNSKLGATSCQCCPPKTDSTTKSESQNSVSEKFRIRPTRIPIKCRTFLHRLQSITKQTN